MVQSSCNLIVLIDNVMLVVKEDTGGDYAECSLRVCIVNVFDLPYLISFHKDYSII